MIQVTELNTKHTFFNTCSHLHVSTEGNILFVITHAQSGPVRILYLQSGPVRKVSTTVWKQVKPVVDYLNEAGTT